VIGGDRRERERGREGVVACGKRKGLVAV